jgi:cytosine/adenosine deaminase-related metal-dependent hydrolase
MSLAAATASWVWCGPGRLRQELWVVAEAGRITGLAGRPPAGARRLELGQGLLLPGLVNAHTHLELSFLQGLVPRPAGDFLAWVEGLVGSRPGYDRERAKSAARRAAEQAAETGTALAGDITNTGRAAWAWQEAGVGAVSFTEAVGPARSQPQPPELAWPGGVLAARGVAAHAPYSVPAGRLRELKRLADTGRPPLSIHCAESRAEAELFAGQGPEGERMAAFLGLRGLRARELGLAGPTPLAHLLGLGVVDEGTLLVHGVQLGREEIGQVAASGASLCMCPRSNLGLTGAMADAPALLAAGVNLCLGTDSLASAPDLDLWAEMRALLAAHPELDPEAVLAMATAGGARALGLEEHFGALAPGKVAALCFAPAPGAGRGQVLESAIAHGGGRVGLQGRPGCDG